MEVRPIQFRCDVRPHRSVVIVAPIGELDIATAPKLEETLAELRDVGFAHLAVDLRGLDFMDSSGLNLLLAWTRRAEHEQLRFSVIGGGQAQRVLDVSGVAERLDMVTERELRGT